MNVVCLSSRIKFEQFARAMYANWSVHSSLSMEIVASNVTEEEKYENFFARHFVILFTMMII